MPGGSQLRKTRPTPLGGLHLVGQGGDARPDGHGVDQAHRLLVAGLAEQPLAGAEHDREDEQPQLVDQVVLDQRPRELVAGVDDDLAVELAASASRPRSTTSPFSTVELVHSGSSSVEDTTYLGRPFNRSAHSPLREPARPRTTRRCAGRAAGPRRASASSSTTWPTPRGPPTELAEPAAVPEALLAAGSWTTPSSETFCADHDLSHSVLLSSDCCLLRSSRRPPRRKLSGEFRAAPTSLPVMRVNGRVCAMMRA